MNRHKAFWLPLALGLTVLACDDDPLRPTDVAGDYILATVDGSPVPQDIAEVEGGVVVILGGQLTLTESGEYELVVLIETQPSDPGDITTSANVIDTGDFDLTEDDQVVLFSSADAPTRIGVVSGSRVRLPIEVVAADGIEVAIEFHR